MGTDGVVVSYHDPEKMLAAFGLPPSPAVPLRALGAIARTAAGGAALD